MKKKKIFVIADIHGHYNETKNALIEAGYDENNDEHLLIILGDIFDRGTWSKELYEWLKPLTNKNKAIVIKGNHEPMFIDFLKKQDGVPRRSFNHEANGMRYTIDSFLEDTAAMQTYWMYRGAIPGTEITEKMFAEWANKAADDINNEYPELLNWLESFPYYFETSKYIFTHGAIDGKCNDWHYPHCDSHSGAFKDWKALTWDSGDFFSSSIINTNKTIVIGHFDTGELRWKYGIGPKSDHSILTRKDGKIIAIDGCTILSKIVNVLVIEDEELLDDLENKDNLIKKENGENNGKQF